MTLSRNPSLVVSGSSLRMRERILAVGDGCGGAPLGIFVLVHRDAEAASLGERRHRPLGGAALADSSAATQEGIGEGACEGEREQGKEIKGFY